MTGDPSDGKRPVWTIIFDVVFQFLYNDVIFIMRTNTVYVA